MRSVLSLLACAFALAACHQSASSAGGAVAGGADIAGIPSGDIAGSARSTAAANIRNPLEGNPAAIAEGKRLFIQMNCAGCHGYDLGGSMGPNLKDNYWRYGGSPAAVYRSIANGHPQGMPAWSQALPQDQIWKLVSYIQSYGGMVPPDNYQGALQGDYAAKTTDAAGGTGAQASAKGGAAPAAQPANP